MGKLAAETLIEKGTNAMSNFFNEKINHQAFETSNQKDITYAMSHFFV